MEGLCGRDCETCAYREQLNCGGCHTMGRCPVAVCCREKGHETCGTCTQASYCGLRRSGAGPEARLREQEVLQAREAWMRENAPLLGSRLWLLFWLLIPNILANVMTLDQVAAAFPKVGLAGEVLSLFVSTLHALVLLSLRRVNRSLGLAGILNLVSGGCTVLMIAAAGGSSALVLLLLFSVLGVSIAAMYFEFRGCWEVLDGLNDDLAGKWRMVWKWTVGLLAGMVGCIVLAFLIPALALLALLADLIGILVISVMQWVYLYRTARLFRDWTARL